MIKIGNPPPTTTHVEMAFELSDDGLVELTAIHGRALSGFFGTTYETLLREVQKRGLSAKLDIADQRLRRRG